jgi:3',5'-cyclic AMP phosphodiesterase CpdA
MPPAISEAPAGPQGTGRPAGFCLAHLSDLHLTGLEQARCSQLLSKRILGYLSWRIKRRHLHRRDILDALTADLAVTCPDHLALTGDLTHIGLPEEFAAARQWLKELGPPERITVIPGNHEAYAGRAWIRSCAMWAPYLESDERLDLEKTADFFPSLRVRAGVALIGLCSARASLPFLATGRLGRSQLDGLATLLDRTAREGLRRVVLVHHPPVPGTIKWRKRLTDSPALQEVLARHGADLVLHGHTHYPLFSRIATAAGSIPVVGAASATEWNPRAGRAAAYNLYRIAPDGRMTLTVRSYSEELGQFTSAPETALSL